MLLTVKPASTWSLDVYVIFYQGVNHMIAILCLQAASLACAVRLANATHSLGAALRASQRITLRDWQT